MNARKLLISTVIFNLIVQINTLHGSEEFESPKLDESSPLTHAAATVQEETLVVERHDQLEGDIYSLPRNIHFSDALFGPIMPHGLLSILRFGHKLSGRLTIYIDHELQKRVNGPYSFPDLDMYLESHPDLKVCFYSGYDDGKDLLDQAEAKGFFTPSDYQSERLDRLKLFLGAVASTNRTKWMLDLFLSSREMVSCVSESSQYEQQELLEAMFRLRDTGLLDQELKLDGLNLVVSSLLSYKEFIASTPQALVDLQEHDLFKRVESYRDVDFLLLAFNMKKQFKWWLDQALEINLLDLFESFETMGNTIFDIRMAITFAQRKTEFQRLRWKVPSFRKQFKEAKQTGKLAALKTPDEFRELFIAPLSAKASALENSHAQDISITSPEQTS